MGERNKRIQAVILSIKKIGESNSLVTMLSKEYGLYSSMLYGGPKSKLKSLVQSFNSGTIWIYEDKVKKSSKITDFEVKSFHEKIKANLYKIWSANLASEVILKTQAAGEAENSFILFSAFLDGIDASDENSAKLGTIRFLWRYLGLLGVQPDIKNCIEKYLLDADAINYLEAINNKSPGEVRRIILESPSVFLLKKMTFDLIEEAVGRKLNSIETGFSIL